MSTALVAIADGNQVRGYHRGADGALVQVAQFLVATVIEPAELAAIIADLGDRFGWAGEPPLQARPAPGSPASLPKRAASAPRRRYTPRADAVAERAAVLDFIREHPNCTRRAIGDALRPDASMGTAMAWVSARLKPMMERLVLTPGTSPTDPDRFRLRDGDQP